MRASTRTHALLWTFTNHDTKDVLAISSALAQSAQAPATWAFLQIPEPVFEDDFVAALFKESIVAAYNAARLMDANDGAIRRFHNKGKHGFILVRSLNPDGPPFFGPSDEATVYALTTPNRKLRQDFVSVPGTTFTPEMIHILAHACDEVGKAIAIVAKVVCEGIEQKAL